MGTCINFDLDFIGCLSSESVVRNISNVSRRIYGWQWWRGSNIHTNFLWTNFLIFCYFGIVRSRCYILSIAHNI